MHIVDTRMTDTPPHRHQQQQPTPLAPVAVRPRLLLSPAAHRYSSDPTCKVVNPPAARCGWPGHIGKSSDGGDGREMYK